MKKLSKNICVGTNVIYKRKSKIYLKLPNHYRVKYYLYDTEKEIYIGIIKKEYKWWFAAFLILIFLNAYLYIEQISYTQYLNLPDIMYCSNGIIALNIVNSKKSEKAVIINLYNNENVEMIEDVYLDSGESVGNIPLKNDLSEGSYMFTLSCSVETFPFSKVKEIQVLIISE